MKKKLQNLISGALRLVVPKVLDRDFLDFKKLVLKDYETISFYELLTKYTEIWIENMLERTAKTKYKVLYEDGWLALKKLNKIKLKTNRKAITYSINIKSVDGKYEDNITFNFFMILHEDEKVLVCKGVRLNENGYIDERYSKSDIDDLFKSIFDNLFQ